MTRQITLILFGLFLLSPISNSLAQTKSYFALSSSGGISLGSFQAGRLYYQNYFLKENQLKFRPSIYTGSSAGAINSLLSLIDICQNTPVSPEDSIYWKVWSPIGLKALTPKKSDGSSDAVFSNKPLFSIAKELKRNWENGFSQECVAYLGIPITLKTPDVLKISPSLSVQRQQITIVLKISGNGLGNFPKIENVSGPQIRIPAPQLYLPPLDQKRFDALVDVLIASAAFPGAFPSHRVRLCLESKTECDYESSKELEFIDGGIYENQPIKLAYLIKRKLDNSPLAPNSFRHVDANGRGFPEESSGNNSKKDSFISTILMSGLSFVDTARNKELYSFLADSPSIHKNINSTISHFPRASEPWGAFFGFFDKGFREFDFLLGMYESELEFEKSEYAQSLIKPSISINKKQDNILGSWVRYSCLRQYLNGTPEKNWDSICKSESLKNLRNLAQLSLWRLYHACQNATDESNWPGCEALSPWGKSVPNISASFQKMYAPPTHNYNVGEYLILSLEKLGYQFDKEEFHNKSPVDEQLRFKLQVLVDRLSERQNSDEQKALKSMGTALLNQYRYLSPRRSVYITFGELTEIGLISRKLPWMRENDKLSFNLAFQVDNGQDLFKSQDGESTLAPLVGFIYPLTGFSDARMQYSVGAALGYLFSANDLKNSGQCINSDNLCNGPLIRPTLGISFMNMFQANIYQRLNFYDDKINNDLNLSIGLNYCY